MSLRCRIESQHCKNCSRNFLRYSMALLWQHYSGSRLMTYEVWLVRSDTRNSIASNIATARSQFSRHNQCLRVRDLRVITGWNKIGSRYDCSRSTYSGNIDESIYGQVKRRLSATILGDRRWGGHACCVVSWCVTGWGFLWYRQWHELGVVKWAMELSATTLGKSLENFAKGWKSDSGVIVDAEMVGWGSAADFVKHIR